MGSGLRGTNGDVFEVGKSKPRTVALFPEDRVVEVADTEIVRIKLSELQLRHPRQWGGCWLACHWYEELQPDGFWAERLKPGRKGTRWDLVLQTLCAYRLIDRAASGGCTGSGLKAVRWLICSALTLRNCPKRTSSIPATI